MPSFRYISRESKVTYKVSREARFIYTSHTTKQWLALREIYIYIYTLEGTVAYPLNSQTCIQIPKTPTPNMKNTKVGRPTVKKIISPTSYGLE